MTLEAIAAQPVVSAPVVTHRLIPSRFPPVQAFEDVASSDDLAAVMELEGWTNDRLVETRARRLDRADWVYGCANASVIMAAFLHASHQGQRFSGPDLGAWYAASTLPTGILEVANGLRRELALSGQARIDQDYRNYTARLEGLYADIRGAFPHLHDPDPAHYPISQAVGERIRQNSPFAGLCYDSVRHASGVNWVCYRPRLISAVTQAGHYRLTVRLSGKVIVETLKSQNKEP